MKKLILKKILAAIERAHAAGALAAQTEIPGLKVEAPRLKEHGDFSTNAAMVMAQAQKKPPRVIASAILDHLGGPELFEKAEIAGPGFINFTLSAAAWRAALLEVEAQGEGYGQHGPGAGRRVLVEFVSANPTGPLHVGHGRGAALGDALARLLTAAGYQVEREYYINDAGNQMLTLGRAVHARYLELLGALEGPFPENLYQGDYIVDMARELVAEKGQALRDLDPEKAAEALFPSAADQIMEGIKKDLADFGVGFDTWYSEKSLFDRGLVAQTLDAIRQAGYLYEQDGATWFRTTALGDDKDRPVVKTSGLMTYIASDLAYHREKYQRGYDLLVDIWGADHHGYVPRIKAGAQAMGQDPERLVVLLVQMVNLLRGGEPVAMSTRAGEFVTLREVMDEVGADAARFYFLTRRSDSQLDFDLEVAKAKSADNPVYYVQYAHARINSVFKKAAEAGLEPLPAAQVDLGLLTMPEELELIKHLSLWPDVLEAAATAMEPHRVTAHVTQLAGMFHPYYNRCRFIGEDRALSLARLSLAANIQRAIRKALAILGVSAPESM